MERNPLPKERELMANQTLPSRPDIRMFRAFRHRKMHFIDVHALKNNSQ
jgi:hypothetical protein